MDINQTFCVYPFGIYTIYTNIEPYIVHLKLICQLYLEKKKKLRHKPLKPGWQGFPQLLRLSPLARYFIFIHNLTGWNILDKYTHKWQSAICHLGNTNILQWTVVGRCLLPIQYPNLILIVLGYSLPISRGPDGAVNSLPQGQPRDPDLSKYPVPPGSVMTEGCCRHKIQKRTSRVHFKMALQTLGKGFLGAAKLGSIAVSDLLAHHLGRICRIKAKQSWEGKTEP